jgi:hypothetical protein
MSRKKQFKSDVPTSILIPAPLQRAIAQRAHDEDRSFSAIVRLAIKKELGIEEDLHDLELHSK